MNSNYETCAWFFRLSETPSPASPSMSFRLFRLLFHFIIDPSVYLVVFVDPSSLLVWFLSFVSRTFHQSNSAKSLFISFRHEPPDVAIACCFSSTGNHVICDCQAAISCYRMWTVLLLRANFDLWHHWKMFHDAIPIYSLYKNTELCILAGQALWIRSYVFSTARQVYWHSVKDLCL